MEIIMKHKIAVLTCMMMIFICVGCGAKADVQPQSKEEETNDTVITESKPTGDDESGSIQEEPTVVENDESESIQDELARIESASAEYENADWDSMGQQEMNQFTAEWYQLWDDELNSLWSRLKDTLDDEAMTSVLKEQRAWLTRKDENIKGAGAAAYGGSLQPQLENSVAEEMTRREYTFLRDILRMQKVNHLRLHLTYRRALQQQIRFLMMFSKNLKDSGSLT
jgi:uncharacterized protein YecT (DUF1311 family)